MSILPEDEQSIGVREARKPRHGWFDYEIYDVFGDELGCDGIGVYMTLARKAYGNFQVKESLRELADHARMSKDTFARNLKKLVQVGLVREYQGPTVKSTRTYELVDVKELAAAVLASYKNSAQSVSHRDSSTPISLAASQGDRKAPSSIKPQQERSDATVGEYDTASAMTSADVSQTEDVVCLPVRQIAKAENLSQNNRPFATDLSQKDTDSATDLSHTAVAFNKNQETRTKTETPLPPQAGDGEVSDSAELVLPDPDVRPDDARWALNAGIAARWVMARMNVPQRRWEERITVQLRRWVWSQRDMGLVDGAKQMVEAWDTYMADYGNGLLRFGPYAKAKFVEDGLWCDRRRWGYVIEPRRDQAGVHVPETDEHKASNAKARAELVQTWVLSQAKAVQVALDSNGIADRMRMLATRTSDDNEAVTDQALQDFEDEMYEAALEALEEEVRENLRIEANEAVRKYTATMTSKQLEEVRSKYFRKIVFDARKLPRLSLFYMGQM